VTATFKAFKADDPEEWAPFESGGLSYEVSTKGRIRRYLRPFGSKRGKYKQVYIAKQGKIFVHQLVAAVFIGKKPEGWHTNHKDGDGCNNDVSNLEYLTHGDNIAHGYKTRALKGEPRRYGERSPRWVLSDTTREEILFLRRSGLAYQQIADKLGIAVHNVRYTIGKALDRGKLLIPKRQMRVCYKPYERGA